MSETRAKSKGWEEGRDGILKSPGMGVQRRLMERSGDDATGACAADIIEWR
jgi:hypothetical protein